MLSLGSLFWETLDTSALKKRLENLGFKPTTSHRYPQNEAVFFGPDSLEIISGNTEGISKFEFDSDDIVNDYKLLKKSHPSLEKPSVAIKDNHPLWFGFNLPDHALFNGWVVMDSPESMAKMSMEVLPRKHPNTCFGIESVTCSSSQPEEMAKKWSAIINQPHSGLAWNELVNTHGFRVISGRKFIDWLPTQQSGEGVFMITFKVADLEFAKELCKKSGAQIAPCNTRDGFIVTGTPHLRFVRSFWKQYLPQTKTNFPFYRRDDKFRSLGGAFTSTLVDGFEDNWKY